MLKLTAQKYKGPQEINMSNYILIKWTSQNEGANSYKYTIS